MQQASTTDPLYFLPPGSEMATLIRRKDWSQTPLGPPENWPQSLRTLVHMMLTSRFPMLIFWGPELTTFYNDAFRPSLGNNGKHPVSLGQQGEESWAESWSVIGPMIYGIMAGGEAVFFEDQKLPIYRQGQMDYAYWTYSFSPLADDAGGVGGILVTCSETTKAVETRQQLADSKMQLQHVFQQAPVAICILQGPTFVIDLANEEQLNIWGRPGENLLGKPIFEALPEASGQGFEQLLDGVMATGEPVYANELSIQLLRSGQPETVYVNVVYRPLRDQANRIVGVISVATQVTEQVLARQQVSRSEQLLDAMVQRTPVGLAVFSGADNVIERVNPALSVLWNRPAEAVLHKPLFEAAPEVQGQGFDELLNSVRKTGQPFVGRELPAQLVRNGRLETVFFDFVYEPLPGPDGNIDRVMVVASEVTEQILARQKLEASETRIRSIIANAPAAMGLLVGRDLVIELPNQVFIDAVGKGPDIAGKPLREVMPELTTENQPFLQILDDVYTSGKMFQTFGSPAMIMRDGVLTEHYYNLTYTPLHDAAGEVFAILDIGIDVTDQIRAQSELAQQKTHLQNAITVADLGTFAVDLVSSMATVSETTRQWFDAPSTSEPLEWMLSKIHPHDLPRVQAAIGAALQSEEHSTHDIVYRIVGPTGEGDTYVRSFGKARYQDGVAQTLVGVLQNVTAQVLARRQLEDSESEYRQLATELDVRVQQRTQDLERSNFDLMQFASVASHDLKEPLRKVQTFATRLEVLLADRMNEEETDLFRRMVNSAARMQALVSDVLRLSKLSDTTATFRAVNLNAVIELIRDDLELTVQEQGAEVWAGSLPTVQAEPTQMHQLFLNLLSNALKFQDAPPPLIRIEAVPLTELLVAELGLPGPDFVVVAVSDNGIGFDPKYSDRIFGMFQRLHGRSQYAGTGMGLTIVKKIVENHRGYIDVQSQPGQGTTFRVALPLAPAPGL